MKTQKNLRGFTVVELMIVIVVIAILATVTIVAYTNARKSARVAKNIADLALVDKAIDIYYARNGSYPNTDGAWIWSRDNATGWVPGLAPKYIGVLPTIKDPATVANSTLHSYAYRSNGTEYKVMVHADDLCEDVRKARSDMIAPSRAGPPCWAYGFWSPGAANW